MAFVVYFFIVKPYEKAKDEVLPGRARRRDDRPQHRAAPRDPRRAARAPRLTSALRELGRDPARRGRGWSVVGPRSTAATCHPTLRPGGWATGGSAAPSVTHPNAPGRGGRWRHRRRVTPSAAGAARAASGRAGLSPGFGSSRAARRPARRRPTGWCPVARPGADAPGASTARAGCRSAGPLAPTARQLVGVRGSVITRGLRTPAASRIRDTSRAGSRKTSVDHTRRCRQPEPLELLGAQPVPVAGGAHRGVLRPVGLHRQQPAALRVGSSTARSTGSAASDVLVHDQPVGRAACGPGRRARRNGCRAPEAAARHPRGSTTRWPQRPPADRRRRRRGSRAASSRPRARSRAGSRSSAAMADTTVIDAGPG